MDSTKNEIEKIDIEGFPTIKMFKKETNEEIDYLGIKASNYQNYQNYQKYPIGHSFFSPINAVSQERKIWSRW